MQTCRPSKCGKGGGRWKSGRMQWNNLYFGLVLTVLICSNIRFILWTGWAPWITRYSNNCNVLCVCVFFVTDELMHHFRAFINWLLSISSRWKLLSLLILSMYVMRCMLNKHSLLSRFFSNLSHFLKIQRTNIEIKMVLRRNSFPLEMSICSNRKKSWLGREANCLRMHFVKIKHLFHQRS